MQTTAVEQAVLVPELAEDIEIRTIAARFIGKHAMSESLSANNEQDPKKIDSLHDAIKLAAEGDETARKMINENVRTDLTERTFKSGHVSRVELSVDDSGKIQQFGQTMESVQANSLQQSAGNVHMLGRTVAETRNAFRMQKLWKEGMLEDHSFVVISRAPDNMDEKTMDTYGFFTKTMTCSIQVTTAKGATLTTETVFVSGVKQPGAVRHDRETAAQVLEHFGVKQGAADAVKMIDMPVLIPNESIKNGAIDMAALWDRYAGGTFFGEDREVQDYAQYLEVCRERDERFEPIAEKITAKLIASADTITSQTAAIDLLDELSECYMVDQAIGDSEIDPEVFGVVAAGHIEAARMYLEQGNLSEFFEERVRAQETAVSSSCPTLRANDEKTKDKTDTDADCEFVSKQCPKCGAKNVKTKVTKLTISGSCGCKVTK